MSKPLINTRLAFSNCYLFFCFAKTTSKSQITVEEAEQIQVFISILPYQKRSVIAYKLFLRIQSKDFPLVTPTMLTANKDINYCSKTKSSISWKGHIIYSFYRYSKNLSTTSAMCVEKVKMDTIEVETAGGI